MIWQSNESCKGGKRKKKEEKVSDKAEIKATWLPPAPLVLQGPHTYLLALWTCFQNVLTQFS